MKMLFISLNQETGFRPVFPIGANIVANAVKQMGWETKLLDLCFSTKPLEEVTKEMVAFSPDFIGISIRNLDFQSYLEPVFHLPFIKRVVDTIKKCKESAVIILGGSGFTLAPKEILRYLQVPYGIYGPGENALPMFLRCLIEKRDISNCDSLVWIDGNGNVRLSSRKSQVDNFFYFTKEQRLGHYNMQYYIKEWKTEASPITEICDAVEGKRGCTENCIYCTNSAIARTKLLMKNPVLIVDEIEDIIQIGLAKRYEFTEGAFNLPITHAKAVIKELKRRNIKFPWNCMFSPTGYEDDLVKGMAETGCDLVEMGIESGSDTILHNLRKNFTFQKVIEAQKGLLANGIRIEHCIFIGSPGETEATVKESLEWVGRLLDDKNVHVFINFGYRIFPGTELAQIAVEKNVINKDTNLAFPHYYIEQSVLYNDKLLDYIEDWTIAHKNSYLWWGIPRIHLKERVEQVAIQHKQMQEIFVEMEKGLI